MAHDDDHQSRSQGLERRAKLRDGRKRTREMRIRVSNEEHGEIRAAATQAGMAYSAFIVRTVRAAIRDQKPIDGALFELHKELRNASRQVNAVGVNLNQLARFANTHGTTPEALAWLAEYCFRVVREAEAVIIRLGRRLP